MEPEAAQKIVDQGQAQNGGQQSPAKIVQQPGHLANVGQQHQAD